MTDYGLLRANEGADMDLTTTYEPNPMFRASWVCRFQLPNGAQRESWGESAAEAIDQARLVLAQWEADQR
jgi:hypothetical protein